MVRADVSPFVIIESSILMMNIDPRASRVEGEARPIVHTAENVGSCCVLQRLPFII